MSNPVPIKPAARPICGQRERAGTRGRLQSEGSPSHSQPGSIWQVASQPSPGSVPPSSHVSAMPTRPSPQTTTAIAMLWPVSAAIALAVPLTPLTESGPSPGPRRRSPSQRPAHPHAQRRSEPGRTARWEGHEGTDPGRLPSEASSRATLIRADCYRIFQLMSDCCQLADSGSGFSAEYRHGSASAVLPGGPCLTRCGPCGEVLGRRPRPGPSGGRAGPEGHRA
jgi:hypothetical protein